MDVKGKRGRKNICAWTWTKMIKAAGVFVGYVDEKWRSRIWQVELK